MPQEATLLCANRPKSAKLHLRLKKTETFRTDASANGDHEYFTFFFFETVLGVNLIRELFIAKRSPVQTEKVEKK